jgi:hypothetical protein
MLKTILKEDLGHKSVNYENVNKERMAKVREKNTYKKWSKENIHLFVCSFALVDSDREFLHLLTG